MGAITQEQKAISLSSSATPLARNQLPLLLDRTTIAVETLRVQWRALATLGTHERMAISQLRVYGSMPMSSLADRMSLSRAAITSLIDRLERDGWVQRTSDRDDRRRTVVELLPQSASTFSEISESFNHGLINAANDLSNEQWTVVTEFLTSVGDLADHHARELRNSTASR